MADNPAAPQVWHDPVTGKPIPEAKATPSPEDAEPGYADPKRAEWQKAHQQPAAAAQTPPPAPAKSEPVQAAAAPAKPVFSKGELKVLHAAEHDSRGPFRSKVVEQAQHILEEHGLATGNKNHPNFAKDPKAHLDGIKGDQTKAALAAAFAPPRP